MTLYLVRHAIAEERTRSTDDEARALTPKGRAKMERATRGLRQLGVQPARVLTSPLQRARETAEILSRGLGGIPVEETPTLAPGVAAHAVFRMLREGAAEESVALVGHEPGLGLLASYLLTGSPTSLRLEFKKAGVVCLELGVSSRTPDAVLHWFLAPKQLRTLG